MSTENSVTALAHIESVGKFIGHAQVLETIDQRHEFTHADSFNPSVDLACLVADADYHGVTATITGVFVQGGKNFVIVGAKAYPLDELRFHGVLSGGDVGEIAYVMKYLSKALACAVGV